jgi:hypothetical protein
MLMIVVTVVAMLVVVSFSQNVIAARNAQMGEKLTVESVSFNASHIILYVRNVGLRNIILEQVKINGVLNDLESNIVLPSPDANFKSEVTQIALNDSFEEGVYLISFISSFNSDLGSTEIEYSLPPRIRILTPTVGQKINDPTPTISIDVYDASNISDIASITMNIDQSHIAQTELNNDTYPLDNTRLYVYYNVTPSDLTQNVSYHIVSVEVVDSLGNFDYKRWWFELDTKAPGKVFNVTVSPSNNTLNISWNPNSEPDISHYEINRSKTIDGSYIWVNNTSNNSYLDKGLEPATGYFYKVTAVDTSGNKGLPSNWVYRETEGERVRLYIDGFIAEDTDWNTDGTNPWLYDNSSFIFSDLNGMWQGNFTFEDNISTNIYSVYLGIEVNGSSLRNDTCSIYLYDGSWSLVEDLDPDGSTYVWYLFNVTEILDTWSEINGAQLKVQYILSLSQPAPGSTIYIRQVYLEVKSYI